MTRLSRTLLGYVFVAGAALGWATIGIFYTLAVEREGLHPLTVVAYRTLLAGLILGIVLLLRRGRAFRVRREHWPLFLAYVGVGIVVFYALYAYAIILLGVAVAVVLLYTAPAWVALIAGLFLHEPITRRVVVALGLTWVGVVFVARAYDVSQLQANGVALLVGLATGLLYGLYSIFQKVIVRHYRPWTVQWYGLFWGGLVLALIQPERRLFSPLEHVDVYVWFLALALISTLIPGLLYTTGVQWVPVSVASIIATLEPVAATFFGYVFLGERLVPAQWVGGACILLAVWLLRPGRASEREGDGARHAAPRAHQVDG